MALSTNLNHLCHEDRTDSLIDPVVNHRAMKAGGIDRTQAHPDVTCDHDESRPAAPIRTFTDGNGENGQIIVR